MRVLLIDPLLESSYACPSLGLLYIAAVLEKADVDVEIAEFRFMSDPWNDLKKLSSKKDYNIVGITVSTYTVPLALKAAKLMKYNNPNTYVVLGGVHPTFMYNQILAECPEVDVIVIGEGEITMLELVKALNSDKKNVDFKNIRGLAFRIGRKIVRTQPRPLINDLDALPFPARHLIPMHRYREMEDSTTIITSRGCTFGCVFCSSTSFWQRKLRMRSAKNVVDELEEVVVKYRFPIINFADDVFTYSRKRTIEICDEIKSRGLDVEWECSAHVNTLSKELLIKMKKSGCRAIFLGVESGCQKTLNIIGKQLSIEKIEKVAKLFKELGIKAKFSFILGCPFEGPKETIQTFTFAEKLQELSGGSILFNLLKAYPGSEIFNYPHRYNITNIDTEWGWKYGAPLYPTCESKELSMQDRFRIALTAALAQCSWSIKMRKL